MYSTVLVVHEKSSQVEPSKAYDFAVHEDGREFGREAVREPPQEARAEAHHRPLLQEARASPELRQTRLHRRESLLVMVRRHVEAVALVRRPLALAPRAVLRRPVHHTKRRPVQPGASLLRRPVWALLRLERRHAVLQALPPS